MSKIFGVYSRPVTSGGLGIGCGSAQSVVSSLNMHRSVRLAALDTVFPPLHWLFLSLLSTSVLTCFLLESDQETILFLDNVQLRLLFTMLVGGECVCAGENTTIYMHLQKYALIYTSPIEIIVITPLSLSYCIRHQLYGAAMRRRFVSVRVCRGRVCRCVSIVFWFC